MIFLLSICLPARAQESGVSVDELSRKADVIGVATVGGVEIRENPDNHMVYTYYSLKFSDVWKGSPADPAVLMQAGGVLGNRTVAIAGRDYTLQPGQTFVLFARVSPLGPYVIIGINQGLYQLGVGADRPLRRLSEPNAFRLAVPLATLKREVCASLGVEYQPPAASVPTLTPEKKAEPAGPAARAKPQATESTTPRENKAPQAAPGSRWAILLGGALVVIAVLWILLSKKNRQSLID
ncbi:MAG TPA: hypothetical protein VE981_10200 [Planctomycetota bacterium]|nr:hypothetical protein [Planctomycetota bacterium]